MIFPQKKKEHKQVEFTYNSETGEKEVVINDVKFDNTYSKNSSGYVNASAILGGKDIRVDNECFTGADLCVVMGAVDLNLKNAIISEDVYINVSAVMGGVDIYVPSNVRVVTDGCSTVMGGIDVNTSYANFHAADTPRVIITGSCVMGGIDIK
jgi:predicted membrane protein